LHRKPISPPLLAAVLAGLAMLGPFSIDTYLPTFPAIGREFAVTPAGLQQTLTAYFLPFAVMTLFHGTLSDSFGRRPVILASLVVYIVASVGCAVADDFGQLLLFRALQGMSAGAGMVVGRAMIRDSFEGHAAQRLMALVMIIFGLAPAIAPVVGGYLLGWFGWRSIFVFLTLYALLLLAVSFWRLPETHPPAARQPFALAPLAANYWKLARSPQLMLLCIAVALNFAGFFIYVVSAPAFIYDLLGLNERQFAWLFVPGIAGVMFGAFLSGRFAGRVSYGRTVAIAYVIMFSAAAFNVTYSALAEPALPWSVLPVMIYTCGMALAMPSITLLALELFPANRGMTSSLQGFMQSFTSGIVAGTISPLLSHSDVTLALGMTGLLCIGCAAWLAYLRVRPAVHAGART
jgi:MFS transporter, DHA1 family, multidrug resistance protein